MFIHLHCHSHYSFLRAVPRPEEIVAAAAEHAHALGPALPRSLAGGAVALTDSDGLYAAVPFYLAARKAGVKPIVGTMLDVELCRGEPVARPFQTQTAPGDPPGRPYNSIVLLAADLAGYSNLCRLVTRRHLEERPVRLEELNECREGLIALYAPAEVEGSLAALKDIFGDALYLEAQRFPTGAASSAPTTGTGRRLRETLRLSYELGVPVAATNNVHFIKPEEHLHHRVLNAIRTGTLLSKIAPPEITSAEAYFKSAEEMQHAFADHPEALRATLAIAERCNVELELGKTIFPEFPVPAGETPFSYLWKLCFEGARRRYTPPGPEVLARLTHELEVIHTLHLAPYFLLVWDIVEEARRRGIPAVARGSAASSMVTYCLGISRVCPLRWELYFERFLNEQRGDVPDIDLDICGARRDELLDYVYRRWGQEHVAMIASFITMHARLAVREVAKVFGVPPAEVNHFTRRLPHRPVREILEAIRTLPECRALPAQEEPWRTVLAVALRLDDFPRHLGIHPCGTVIAAQPLTRLVPLEVATKGIVVTQYDMHAVEALGLVKMDLLGQRGLTTMSLALRNIGSTGLQPVHLKSEISNSEFQIQDSKDSQRACMDFDAIPEGDAATCTMLAQGRTMGIFQIESPGMRGLLRALGLHRPASPESANRFTLEDICLALALIRPGAAEYGSKETFLRRLRGQEPVRYPHPSLAPILRETLGVCVYQEQVMQLAQAAGALSLAEADLVRRASAKFADERERRRLHAKFLKAAERMGIADAARDETWQMVEKFAGFGFCKAHAATYADLAYRMAYLKAHYPAEFLAAMCSSGAGFYHVSAYVEEAKRWGLEVRLPSVNHSRVEYTTEPSRSAGVPPAFLEIRRPEASATRAMRIGLMQVKGLRAETMAAIVRSREERGAFCSLEDFLTRVSVERDEIESLIKCGAFDEVGQASSFGQAGAPAPPLTRPALLWQLNLLGARGESIPRAEEMLFPRAEDAAARMTAATPFTADYTREQRLRYEQEILEVCVSGHPLDSVPRNGEAWSTELAAHPGRRVTLLGWLITFRRVGTKNYRNMMFVTLEDQRGVYEAVLFPEAYERYGGLVFETRTLRVTGRVEADGNINCEKLEAVRA